MQCDINLGYWKRNKDMKMCCSEGSKAGEDIRIELYIQEQEAIDNGAEPQFIVDLSEFYPEDYEDSAFLLTVPAIELLSDQITNKKDAETVAQWLELWAEDIREKFNIRMNTLHNDAKELRRACSVFLKILARYFFIYKILDFFKNKGNKNVLF